MPQHPGAGAVKSYATLQHGFLRSHLHDGFVMAMSGTSARRASLGSGKASIIGPLLEKFTEQKDLLREGLRALVFGGKG